jgi:hypothetical protein
MLLEGHVENGQIVLDQPAELPEGARVRVEVVAPPPRPASEIPTLLERLKGFVGVLELPADAALNHDHYLYGTPKKQ